MYDIHTLICSRMTGAMLLPSTDHMIKQYGEDCLGSCARVWLRLVHDDPEKTSNIHPRRILRTRISRGSTYAYIQGILYQYYIRYSY